MSAIQTRAATIIACLLIVATPASAGGINLSWSECGNGGTMNRAFACNTNSGTQSLVVSFEPLVDMSNVTGLKALIDIQFDGVSIPDWWQLGVGGCREGSLTLDPNFIGAGFCADFWGGQGIGSWTYVAGSGYSNRAQVAVNITLAAGGAPVSVGTEYYGFRLILDDSKAIGSGACTGCATPACLIVDEVTLVRPNASGGDYLICDPRDRNFASWQGTIAFQCPAIHSVPYCQSSAEVHRTWGQIKSLYR